MRKLTDFFDWLHGCGWGWGWGWVGLFDHLDASDHAEGESFLWIAKFLHGMRLIVRFAGPLVDFSCF
jgi:hypothetical protein